MESEGDTGDCEEDDLKVGKVAIGGEYGFGPSGGRGNTTSGFEWGDCSGGECIDSMEQEVEIKEAWVSSPKSGGVSSAVGVVGKGRVCKSGIGGNPKSIVKVDPIGDRGYDGSEGVRAGGSQGLKGADSGISFQQSQSKRTPKEEGDVIEHIQSRGAVRGSQHECFTLFVGNIPVTLSSSRLKLIFMAFGDVIDVFIPQKSSKFYNSRFAFVRFKSRAEADRAIQDMDGAELEGQHLVVNFARFSRDEAISLHKPLIAQGFINGSELRKPWSRVSEGLSYAQAVQKLEDRSGDQSDVRRKICITSGNLEWLSASLVGTLRVGLEFGKIRNILIGLSEEVKVASFLGGCRCLVTFSSVISRNSALKDPVWFEWFFSMEPWTAESVGSSHRFWITCVGVPVMAWNAEFFALIGKQWGRLIDVDEETLNRSQFVRACLLIESSFCDIDESFDLDVDGYSYIVQVSSSVHHGQVGAQCCKSSKVEGNGSVGSCNPLLGVPSKVKEGPDLVRNMVCGSPEKLGGFHSAETSSIAGTHCSGFQLLAGNELRLSDDITPMLFGYVEKNAIRILDEDAGCLTRINGTEEDCRIMLNVSEMSGGSVEEDCLSRKFQSEAMQVCSKPIHKELDAGYKEKTVVGHDGFGNCNSGDPVEVINRDVCQHNSGSVDGTPVSVSLGSKVSVEMSGLNKHNQEVVSNQQKIANGVVGSETCKVPVVRRDCVVVDKVLGGEKIKDEGGGSIKSSVQKFVESQEFINSSINLTTDVLVECKLHGISISAGDQRAIIEAMTKRHIQAEVDFYAESSLGGSSDVG